MMLNSKSIGNKIAAARKKIELSQSELAQQVSISAQAVGKWERGESMPDIITLNRLAEIFGVDLNYFSDNFHTDKIEKTTSEKIDKQTIGTPEAKPRKKFDWNWDMSKGNWVDADFSGLKNLNEKFSASNMKNCKFIGSEMSGLTLENNYVEKCDFQNSDLRNSKIQSSHLTNSKFDNCSLIDTEFVKANLEGCNFESANFSGTEFYKTNFRRNHVEDAVWKHTSFKETSLDGIVFKGLIEDCAFEFCTFNKVNFKNATLKKTFFKCKSLKHLTFIDSQADRMTYEFLKNGKANLTGISLIS